MASPSRLFLVGPMGAGKSTVGRHLAGLVGFRFIDTDQEIERRAGADIPWIFDVEGEDGFRDREQAVLESLIEGDRVVLATGGGAIMRAANRELMAAHGTTVYLHASLDEQVRRTRKDGSRPLLAGRDRREVLSELMTIRDPLYREVADLVINANGDSAARLAARIAEQLTPEEPPQG